MTHDEAVSKVVGEGSADEQTKAIAREFASSERLIATVATIGGHIVDTVTNNEPQRLIAYLLAAVTLGYRVAQTEAAAPTAEVA